MAGKKKTNSNNPNKGKTGGPVSNHGKPLRIDKIPDHGDRFIIGPLPSAKPSKSKKTAAGATKVVHPDLLRDDGGVRPTGELREIASKAGFKPEDLPKGKDQLVLVLNRHLSSKKGSQ